MKLPRLFRLPSRSPDTRPTGSLTRRMIGVSALWIVLLLGFGGYALDRVLSSAVTSNFDTQLDYVLTAMIASSEIGPEGEVLFNRPPADQRFLEPYSGLYYQISGGAADPFDVAPAFGPRSVADRRRRCTRSGLRDRRWFHPLRRVGENRLE